MMVPMSEAQPNNPLHGIKLEQIVMSLAQHYGWEELGQLIEIRCFVVDPSVKSSLKFLRRTPWARSKVEELYLDTDWQGGTVSDSLADTVSDSLSPMSDAKVPGEEKPSGSE